MRAQLSPTPCAACRRVGVDGRRSRDVASSVAMTCLKHQRMTPGPGATMTAHGSSACRRRCSVRCGRALHRPTERKMVGNAVTYRPDRCRGDGGRHRPAQSSAVTPARVGMPRSACANPGGGLPHTRLRLMLGGFFRSARSACPLGSAALTCHGHVVDQVGIGPACCLGTLSSLCLLRWGKRT